MSIQKIQSIEAQIRWVERMLEKRQIGNGITIAVNIGLLAKEDPDDNYDIYGIEIEFPTKAIEVLQLALECLKSSRLKCIDEMRGDMEKMRQFLEERV